MMRLPPCSAALFSPSNATPELSEPSPITATTLPMPLPGPSMSRVFARPQAKEIEVPVCPSTNWSCSLSSGLVKPVTSPKRFGSIYAPARPVSILWT